MYEVQVTHTIGSAGMSSVNAEVRLRFLPKEAASTDDGGGVSFHISSSCSNSSVNRTYIRWLFVAQPEVDAEKRSLIAEFMDNSLAPHRLSLYCTPRVNGSYGAALRELGEIGKGHKGHEAYRPMFRAAVGELHQILFRTYARVLLRALRALHLRREPIRRARARAAIEYLESSSGGGCGGAALVNIVAAWLR